MVNSADVQRRMGLIDNLEKQVGGSLTGSGGGVTADLLGMGEEVSVVATLAVCRDKAWQLKH